MDQLSRALKSTLNAQLVKIKLTKRQGAYLSVEVVQVCDCMCHLMNDVQLSFSHLMNDVHLSFSHLEDHIHHLEYNKLIHSYSGQNSSATLSLILQQTQIAFISLYCLPSLVGG